MALYPMNIGGGSGGGGGGYNKWIGICTSASALTEQSNDISGCTYTSPDVSLPNGKYKVYAFISWGGPSGTNYTRMKVYLDGNLYDTVQTTTAPGQSYFEYTLDVTQSLSFNFGRSGGQSPWFGSVIIEKI